MQEVFIDLLIISEDLETFASSGRRGEVSSGDEVSGASGER